MITLDVRMGPFESDERDVLADTAAIFLMLDSPLLTIQVLLPYTRCGGRTAVSNVHYTEMPGDEGGAPCRLFKVFSGCSARGCVLKAVPEIEWPALGPDVRCVLLVRLLVPKRFLP